KPPDLNALLNAFTRALSSPVANEQYMVVTMRLPVNVLQILTDVDPNLERAITRICNDCGEQVKALTAKP
ncbi:MAG TPA: hypothetical protein VGB76_18550, partial [Pyrinomonadaceae bacterium]